MPCIITRKLVISSLSLTLSLLCATTAPAAEKTFSEYPKTISNAVRNSNYPEDAISHVLRSIGSYKDEADALSEKGIDDYVQTQLRRARVQQVERVLINDMNNDGAVSFEEMAVANEKQSQSRLRSSYATRRLEELQSLDTNNDKSISYAEMRAVSEKYTDQLQRTVEPMKELLAADPNKDGKMTVDELREMTKAAFTLVDTDNDGTLSPDEKNAAMRSSYSANRQDFSNYPTPAPYKIALPEKDELHVVGVYEGDEDTGSQVHGPQVRVTVDRPGKDVSLMLSSYKPVKWIITTTDKTRLDKIILSEYKGKTSVIEVNDQPRKPDVKFEKAGYTYEPLGEGFRATLAYIKSATGRDKIESFHGEYRPKSAFVINSVVNSNELKVDHLTPVIAKEEDLPDIRFSAKLGDDVGVFNLSGKKLSSLPRQLVNAAYAPTTKHYYALTSDGLRELDENGKTIKEISASLEVPTFNSASGITYDADKDRIIITSFGGKGYWYTYDLKSGKWSALGSFNDRNEVQSIVYDPLTKHYLGTPWNGISRIAKILIFSQKGEYLKTLSIGAKDLPGALDSVGVGTGPGASMCILPSGKYLVLLTGGNDKCSGSNSVSRVYLYNRETQKAVLTWASRR